MSSLTARMKLSAPSMLRRCYLPALLLAPLIAIGANSPDWTTAAPEELGMDSGVLTEMFDLAYERHVRVHSVQIARYGKLALDACFFPFQAGHRHDVASVTKSVTSTLVGLAIDQGLIPNVHQPLLGFFPEYRISNNDPRKQALTLEHLLTMRAGWDCGFEPNEARLFEMRKSPDWLAFMLNLPMVTEPGSRFAYCSGNSHTLSTLLSRVTHTNAFAFARQQLFAPLGIRDLAWPSDPAGNTHGWGDLQMRPTDMLKLGQLLLQRGQWSKRQVLSENWIRESTRPHVDHTHNRDHYGYSWWVKGEDYPGMFEAVGRGGQRINIWPASQLVVVFTGGEFEPGDLAKYIVAAIKSDKPLPPNPDGARKLRAAIDRAARQPSPRPVHPLPGLARSISGHEIAVSHNPVDLESIRLHFNQPGEARVEMKIMKHALDFPVGLDGVERLSANSITGLPHAAKGEWLDTHTFLLEWDLVGAINCYRLQFKFPEGGKEVSIFMAERTGLNNERLEGRLRP